MNRKTLVAIFLVCSAFVFVGALSLGLSGKQPASTAPTTTSSQPPPLSHTALTSSLPSLVGPSTTVASTDLSIAGWSTFTDAAGLYNIQYPATYGALYVTTSTTDGTKDLVTDLILENTATGPDSDNSLDITITPNDPTLESYEVTHVSLIPQASVSIVGATDTVYNESDDGAVVVFLSGTKPGATSTFYLNLNRSEEHT